MPKIDSSVELFIIEPEIFNACSMEEVEATYIDLVELGIAQLPFPNFELRFPISVWEKTQKILTTEALLEVQQAIVQVTDTPRGHPTLAQHSYRDGELVDIKYGTSAATMESMLGRGESIAGIEKALRQRLTNYDDVVSDEQSGIVKLFIVLLATRNAVKDRTEDKLWKLGVGKKSRKRYRYTTVLRLPASEALVNDPQHSTSGQTKRPHLRRGFIRNQRYGTGLAQTKRIWIEPVFIHADEDFISGRTAYSLRPAI